MAEAIHSHQQDITNDPQSTDDLYSFDATLWRKLHKDAFSGLLIMYYCLWLCCFHLKAIL